MPGDFVLDGFAGTGMTGVAARLCGDKAVVESLGYKVDQNKNILAPTSDSKGAAWAIFSKLGERHAILMIYQPRPPIYLITTTRQSMLMRKMRGLVTSFKDRS